MRVVSDVDAIATQVTDPRVTDTCGFSIQIKADSATISGSWVRRGGDDVREIQSASYPLLQHEVLEDLVTVPVRVMTDTRSVEVFLHGGRFVLSTALHYDHCGVGGAGCVVVGRATGGGANVSGVAWSMRGVNG